jgi:hypothetical protein
MLAAAMLLARPVLGQTDATALEAALHGKHLGLLSYSADPVVRFTYVDGKLLQDPIILHGLGVFTTDTVRQKGSKVLIEGQFASLVRSGGSIHLTETLPMQIEVELQGTKPAVVIPQLQALLFFPSLGAALKGLPEYVSDFLPFPVDAKLQPACHCVRVFQDGKWVQVEWNDPKLKPPAFSKMATNPALDQMAIDAKISGTLTLIYFVSEEGRVADIWLAKPLGAGLNESAAKTGRDNVLQPATLDGKPVGSVLIQTIPVN